MQETRLRGLAGDAGRRRGVAWPGPDSVVWLILVCVLFVAAELVPALLRLPLGADEITYVARTSVRSSGVFLPPVHGHGAGLLAAPVTLVTTSVAALRVWMAVLSGAGLFGALVCWRGLRPAWVLAVAGLLFGGLAVTQLSGVQVYPDLWAGLGAVAVTGLVLQAVAGRWRAGVVLPAIGLAAFVLVLMRPQNVVFVLAPALLAPVVVRGWRQPRVLAAMGAGIAAGLAEWVVEAGLWFGGLGHRITLARQEPPTLGLHFSLLTQVKTLSGPWYCDPTTTTGCHPQFSYPAIYIWWLAFFGLAALGLYAVWRRPARASSVFALVTGVWVAALYIFLVPFGAPRYFLPAWALLAVVAADGIAWLVTVPKRKTAWAVAAGVFLASWAVSQHVVLTGETAGAASGRQFAAKAEHLKRLGVKPPCAIGSQYVAYYVGCTAPWVGGTIHEVLARTPGGARAWRKVNLPQGAPYKYAWIRR